jgi:hypothetical protein
MNLTISVTTYSGFSLEASSILARYSIVFSKKEFNYEGYEKLIKLVISWKKYDMAIL